jgi:FAD synthase
MQISEPVTLLGTVTKYKGNGRELGYPTANINTNAELEDGVYFGYASLARWQDHPALIFVGVPTTMGDTERRVEAHLLDIADEDYYDQDLKLRVYHYHRPNQNFESVEELLNAMKNDEFVARQWFKNRDIA